MVTRLQFNHRNDWLYHWNEWLQPGNPDDSRLFHSDSSDRIWVCPPDLGQGYIQEISLRDDLSLNIYDHQFYQDLLIDIPDSINRLEFEFALEGDELAGYSCVVPSFGFKDFVVKRARRVFKLEIVFQYPSLLTYYQAFRERLSCRNQDRFAQCIRGLWHSLGRPGQDPDRAFSQMLRGEIMPPVDIPPEQILSEELAAEVSDLNYVARNPMVPAMEPVIGQILSCPYQGINRRAYLADKVLTLVSLYLGGMVKLRLQDEKLDYIHQAASILRQQLAAPPTIESLARQVSTNRLKLNQGFHRLYGTTPYGYLRNCRLSKARYLMMTSELSIGDIATTVGYTCHSHFSTAFRREVGLNPKVFQMQALPFAS